MCRLYLQVKQESQAHNKTFGKIWTKIDKGYKNKHNFKTKRGSIYIGPRKHKFWNDFIFEEVLSNEAGRGRLSVKTSIPVYQTVYTHTYKKDTDDMNFFE